jgi:hypothetical protein
VPADSVRFGVRSWTVLRSCRFSPRRPIHLAGWCDRFNCRYQWDNRPTSVYANNCKSPDLVQVRGVLYYSSAGFFLLQLEPREMARLAYMRHVKPSGHGKVGPSVGPAGPHTVELSHLATLKLVETGVLIDLLRKTRPFLCLALLRFSWIR